MKKITVLLLGLALAFFVMMSFTRSTENTIQVSSESVISPDNDNCCCPPNWTLFWIDATLYPDDPALKWDNNGDWYVCFKGEWVGNDTPNGNGNDPLYSQSNVKDNNQPCKDDDFNPCLED